MVKNMKYRCDVIELPKKMTKTPEGWLKGDVFITRAGVFPYLDENGKIIWELRHPDDVFKEESLKSFEMLPFTNEHPFVALDSTNTKKYQVGQLGSDVRKYDDNIRVISSVLITDINTVQIVEQKEKTEVSCGYFCDVIEESGIYNGIKYDRRQVNIEGNHVALTKKGRAGETVKLVTDSAVNINDFNDRKFYNFSSNTNKGKTTMSKENVVQVTCSNGIKYDALPEIAAEIDSMKTNISDLSSDNKSLKEKNDSLTQEIATLKGENEQLTKKLNKDSSEDIQKAFKKEFLLKKLQVNSLKIQWIICQIKISK